MINFTVFVDFDTALKIFFYFTAYMYDDSLKF